VGFLKCARDREKVIDLTLRKHQENDWFCAQQVFHAGIKVE
jgi:hypothetical protein